jgi:transcriptional regulator with XRE-family HTH domain
MRTTITLQRTGHEWLQDRMKELNFRSLRAVAREIGINQGNLYRYFTFENRPSISLLPIMCQVFQCTPVELLRALEVIGKQETV